MGRRWGTLGAARTGGDHARHIHTYYSIDTKTAVLVGRRLGGIQLRRSHPLIGAAHQSCDLGVVPRDTVYSREAGMAPPMPPWGRC